MTNNEEVKIISATNINSNEIANLIMLAMNYDCCMNFTGKHRSLSLFKEVLIELINTPNTQYCKDNIIAAVNKMGNLLGIIVSYDGKDLLPMRKHFINLAKKRFDMDWSDMEEETCEGEMYLDSLAVKEQYRGKGIASRLIKAAIEKASLLKIDRVGLLVDANNPQAENLYTRLGFKFVNNTTWGGHKMKHLQINVDNAFLCKNKG